MLASILLAQAISLLFGHSATQFHLSGKTSFSAGIFPAWFILILAPLVEELAWHSYGTDCLRRRMNLFNTCMVFGVCLLYTSVLPGGIHDLPSAWPAVCTKLSPHTSVSRGQLKG